MALICKFNKVREFFQKKTRRVKKTNRVVNNRITKTFTLFYPVGKSPVRFSGELFKFYVSDKVLGKVYEEATMKVLHEMSFFWCAVEKKYL